MMKQNVSEAIVDINEFETLFTDVEQKLNKDTQMTDEEVEYIKTYISKVANHQVNIKDRDEIEIDAQILIPRKFCDELLILEKNKYPNQQFKNLLSNLQNSGYLSSDLVYTIMLRVDRKNFMIDDSFQSAYSDIPRPIRFNTTISAPSMHAITLEKLKDHL